MANFLKDKKINFERIIAFFLLVFSLFFITGILAYKAQGGNIKPQHFLQALVAGTYKLLGLSGALFGLILILIWSARWFLAGFITKPGLKALGIFGLILSGCGLSGVVAKASGGEAGGILGTLMAERVGAILGTTFSLIVFSVLLVSSLLIATNWLFVDEFKEILAQAPKDKAFLNSPNPNVTIEEEKALAGPEINKEEPKEIKLEEKPPEKKIEFKPIKINLDKDLPWKEKEIEETKNTEKKEIEREEEKPEQEKEPLIVIEDAKLKEKIVVKPLLPKPEKEEKEPAIEIPRPVKIEPKKEEKEKEPRKEKSKIDTSLIDEAAKLVINSGRASITLIQRNLGISFSEASRLIDELENLGVVGPYKGSLAREILITLDEWESKRVKEKI